MESIHETCHQRSPGRQRVRGRSVASLGQAVSISVRGHHLRTPRWISIRGSPYAAAGEKLVLVMMKDESAVGGFVWIAFDTSNANFNPLHEGRAVFKAHNIGAIGQGWHTWSYNANAENTVGKVLERKGPSGLSSQEAIMNT